jgi:hypothetical protein
MEDDSPDDASGIVNNEYDVLSGGVLQVCLGDEDAYILSCRVADTMTLHTLPNIWPKVTYSAALLLPLLEPNLLSKNLSKGRSLVTKKPLQAHVMAKN